MKLEEKNREYAVNMRELREKLAEIKSQADALPQTMPGDSGEMRDIAVRLWDAYSIAQQILRAM